MDDYCKLKNQLMTEIELWTNQVNDLKSEAYLRMRTKRLIEGLQLIIDNE